MALKDIIQKKAKRKPKRFAQVSMDVEMYQRVQKLITSNNLKWQAVLHAGLEQFLAEYEKR